MEFVVSYFFSLLFVVDFNCGHSFHVFIEDIMIILINKYVKLFFSSLCFFNVAVVMAQNQLVIISHITHGSMWKISTLFIHGVDSNK